MPIATMIPSKIDPPNDAPPTGIAVRQEVVVDVGRQREPEPTDAADDPYDNMACTD
jgi:hypothetical protein